MEHVRIAHPEWITNDRGDNDMNSPCTITRVIERVAEDLGNSARKLDEAASQARSKDTEKAVCANVAAVCEEQARELRKQAHQLTGRDYR